MTLAVSTTEAEATAARPAASSPLHTTGTLARAAGACRGDFGKVYAAVGGESHGWDTPVPLATVLEIAGLDAALWALRCVPPEQEAARDRLARLFACDAAETALPIFERGRPGDTRPREAIAVARRFAVGDASDEERAAASDAAMDAAMDAARDAASAAVSAAAWAASDAAMDAASDAVRDAARDAASDAARGRLTELFHHHLNNTKV